MDPQELTAFLMGGQGGGMPPPAMPAPSGRFAPGSPMSGGSGAANFDILAEIQKLFADKPGQQNPGLAAALTPPPTPGMMPPDAAANPAITMPPLPPGAEGMAPPMPTDPMAPQAGGPDMAAQLKQFLMGRNPNDPAYAGPGGAIPDISMGDMTMPAGGPAGIAPGGVPTAPEPLPWANESGGQDAFSAEASKRFGGLGDQDWSGMLSDIMAGIGPGPGGLSHVAGGYTRAEQNEKNRASTGLATSQAAEDRTFDVGERSAKAARDALASADTHRKSVADIMQTLDPSTNPETIFKFENAINDRAKALSAMPMSAEELNGELGKYGDELKTRLGIKSVAGPSQVKEGATATNKAGQTITYKGGQWIDQTGKPVPMM